MYYFQPMVSNSIENNVGLVWNNLFFMNICLFLVVRYPFHFVQIFFFSELFFSPLNGDLFIFMSIELLDIY